MKLFSHTRPAFSFTNFQYTHGRKYISSHKDASRSRPKPCYMSLFPSSFSMKIHHSNEYLIAKIGVDTAKTTAHERHTSLFSTCRFANVNFTCVNIFPIFLPYPLLQVRRRPLPVPSVFEDRSGILASPRLAYLSCTRMLFFSEKDRT